MERRKTTGNEAELNVLVVDGQGGMVGKQMVEAVRKMIPDAAITAVGTNTLATASMLKAGENSVVVAVRSADIIVGPIGIVIADSLLGEITPKMAEAIGSSLAKKVLIPVNKCNNIIVGVGSRSTSSLIAEAIETIRQIAGIA